VIKKEVTDQSLLDKIWDEKIIFSNKDLKKAPRKKFVIYLFYFIHKII